jgi:hypothetical protein
VMLLGQGGSPGLRRSNSSRLKFGLSSFSLRACALFRESLRGGMNNPEVSGAKQNYAWFRKENLNPTKPKPGRLANCQHIAVVKRTINDE